MKVVTESALTISLCAILSFITLFKMPFGGSVTLGHTAPLILFSFKNGAKAGFFAGLIYGIFQMLVSFHIPPAKSFVAFLLAVLLDYLIPYSLVGLTPLYVRTVKNLKTSVIMGAVFSNISRLVTGTLSGVIIWDEYVSKNVNIWVYSLIYNSLYIIPEMIITVIICYTFINFLSPSESF